MGRQSVALMMTTVIGAFLILQAVGAQESRLKSQPQGGDRRGTCIDPKRTVISYKDPKTYIHNMTVIEHVPEGGGGGDMMTSGDRRYLIGGRLVVDVTDPKKPAIVNSKAPRGELAYNQALKKWILMRVNSCCSWEDEDLMKGGPSPELSYKGRLGVTFFGMTDPTNPWRSRTMTRAVPDRARTATAITTTGDAMLT
jgi:hypothetical protein